MPGFSPARRKLSLAHLSLIASPPAALIRIAGEAGFDLSRHPAVGRWLERVATQPGHVLIAA